MLKDKYSQNGGALTGIWLAGRSAFINNKTRHIGEALFEDQQWDGTAEQLMEFVKEFDPRWTWIVSKAYARECFDDDAVPKSIDDIPMHKQAC